MEKKRIHDAVRKTNLAFLWEQEGKPYTLKKELHADTHGAVIKGDFIKCLVGSTTLPVGTEGVLYSIPTYSYSAYVWIGDEQYPAEGADRFLIQTSYSFVTMVKLEDGTEVVADGFCSKKHDKPIFAGKAGE